MKKCPKNEATLTTSTKNAKRIDAPPRIKGLSPSDQGNLKPIQSPFPDSGHPIEPLLPRNVYDSEMRKVLG